MTGKGIFLGCIADDFTGAGDLASFLSDAGLSVVLFNGIPEKAPEEEGEVYVIALKSRTAPAAEAVSETLRAAAWLKEAGVKQLYLKYCSTFDSTPEGNIGPAADALLETYAIPYTVLCPSLPVNGRKVKDGKLSVNGVPLYESSMRNHPLTPMKDDRLKELMEAQSRYPAFVVTAEEMTDEKALRERIREYGKQYRHFYLIPDYFEDSHAADIIRCFGDLGLLTGGSGLMTALAEKFLKEAETGDNGRSGPAVPAPRQPGGAVLLAGSCSEMTLKQIAAWRESGAPSYHLSPGKLLDSPEEESGKALSFLSAHPGEDVLLYSSEPVEKVRQVQKAGAEKVSRLLEGLTAELALHALAEGKTRIIVAGGETSGAVTKALGYDAFRIGKSIAPGVPVMIPCDRTDIRLVLKSGNFGDEDFFRKALLMTETPGGEKWEQN